jgi:Adenylate and Guanylate cyclase catalytic domain
MFHRQSFLEGILPPISYGIDVVIENTCGQVFTFKILGKEAVWQGEDDLHDADFDYMVRSAIFGQYLMEPIADPTYYTGAPLDGSFCPYTFYVYPTEDMQSHYLTNKPAVYCASACFIILLTSLIFVSYDRIVERRQRIVAASAQRSDAIVSSLFPQQVKEQLYVQQERNNSGRPTPASRWSKHQIKQPLAEDEGVEDEAEQIASLYPETTILFADIAGFTKWSDRREPHEVFLLLETVYFMFDKIAKRRGVFKFSTIGDCYLGMSSPRFVTKLF